MNYHHFLLKPLLPALLVAFITACGGGGGGGETPQVTSPTDSPATSAPPASSNGTGTTSTTSVPSTSSATSTITLQSLAISPNPATIALGFTQQFTATAFYSNASSKLVTATWNASNTSAIDINSSGVATTPFDYTGNYTITASYSDQYGNKTASVTVTVIDAIVNSLSWQTTPTSTMHAGVVKDVELIATTSKTSYKNATQLATWTSSNSSVATVTAGKITTLAAGNTNINAVYGGKTLTLSLTVDNLAPTSLSIGGPDAGSNFSQPTVFAQGALIQLNSGAFYPDIYATIVGNWSSSNDSVATVVNGLVTTIAPGSVTISLGFRGLTATRVLTVATPVVTPVATINCLSTVPMVITASTWNAAYTVDPSNTTKWLTVDTASCSALSDNPFLVHAATNYQIAEAFRTPGSSILSPVATYSTGRTPQLSAGDQIKVGHGSRGLYYNTYTITVQ